MTLKGIHEIRDFPIDSGFSALRLGGEGFPNRSLVADSRIEEKDTELDISAVKGERATRNRVFRKRPEPPGSQRAFILPPHGRISWGVQGVPARFPTWTNRGPDVPGHPGHKAIAGAGAPPYPGHGITRGCFPDPECTGL